MRTLIFATVLSLAFGAASFAQSSDDSVAYDKDTVLARVNGNEITLGHVIAMMERLPPRYGEMENTTLFPGILDQLIDQALIADTISAVPESDATRFKLILENERRAMLSNHAVEQITAQGVTDAELDAIYNERYAQTDGGLEYNASHILVETAEEAEAAIKAIMDGAEFADVAIERSTGPSGPNGGKLGWFGEGVMVAEFFAGVKGLEVGGVSEPVQTQFGWHVIKLNETREVQPPAMAEVRADLTQELIHGKVQDAIDEMRGAAEIERIEIDVPADAIRETTLIDD